jgi:hypothetical protein
MKESKIPSPHGDMSCHPAPWVEQSNAADAWWYFHLPGDIMTLDEEVLLETQALSKTVHQLLVYLLARCTNAND